jgi:hypothetical protein
LLRVLVERRRPRRLARRRVDLDRPGGPVHRAEHVARHLGDRAVRREREALAATVVALDRRLVSMQIESDHECTRSVRRRQRRGLPAARGQAQRRMLELRLRRRELCGELPEHLRVRVQGVAGLAPFVVRESRPC